MMVQAGVVSGVQGTVVNLRCPACRQRGTFEPLHGSDIQLNRRNMTPLVAGQRRCPDPACHTHVFFISQSGELLATYPPERLDFDASGIPAPVVSALEEAIACHAAGCYVAAAIMVRKTLEELCRHQQATGSNLKERIRALGQKMVIPSELLDGLDDLRLLGNDAAHVESQTYNQVGKEEVEVGVEFAKEVLKAGFQYSTLLGKLRSLKKGP